MKHIKYVFVLIAILLFSFVKTSEKEKERKAEVKTFTQLKDESALKGLMMEDLNQFD